MKVKVSFGVDLVGGAVGMLVGVAVGVLVGLDVGTLQPWPCLYIAENFETAFREKYQLASDASHQGLRPDE